jgi:hypothetical protein
VFAGVATTLVLVLVWRMLAVLPWVVDALIAGAACLAFAYWFERQDGTS